MMDHVVRRIKLQKNVRESWWLMMIEERIESIVTKSDRLLLVIQYLTMFAKNKSIERMQKEHFHRSTKQQLGDLSIENTEHALMN